MVWNSFSSLFLQMFAFSKTFKNKLRFAIIWTSLLNVTTALQWPSPTIVILSVNLFSIIKKIFSFAEIRTHNFPSDNQMLYHWATLADDIWFTILLQLLMIWGYTKIGEHQNKASPFGQSSHWWAILIMWNIMQVQFFFFINL